MKKIEISKIINLERIKLPTKVVFPKYLHNFLGHFIVFERDRILESGFDKLEMNHNEKLRHKYFFVNVDVLVVTDKFLKKPNNLYQNCPFFENCWRNMATSTFTFTEN